jgi:hypothetical protein
MLRYSLCCVIIYSKKKDIYSINIEKNDERIFNLYRATSYKIYHGSNYEKILIINMLRDRE